MSDRRPPSAESALARQLRNGTLQAIRGYGPRAHPGGDKSATVYRRVAAADGSSHTSVDQQRRQCREMAIRLKAQVVREFTDLGWSGNTRQRPGLQEMFSYLATHPVDYVICTDLARLSRNQAIAIDAILRIDEAGSRLALVEGGTLFEVERIDADV